ncbi:hypothetical protein [Gottfriedia solisilvae]|uniref:hypothetical protein n=1 Tax=Gottfriedia solisilvae TaxID=1516104 RepID=UPI003D2EC04F
MNMKCIQLLSCILISMILSGCKISTSKVEKPTQDYLKSEYNIKDYEIISAANDGECGCNYYSYIEIEKPHHSFVYLAFDQMTGAIDLSGSEDVYEQLFKGAFIEQYPSVISNSKKLIKKYHLINKSPEVYSDEDIKQNFYYFLNIDIDKKQQNELIKNYKNNNYINISKTLPKLNNESKKQGIVQFNYYYNIYKNKNNVPQALEIMKDMEKSKVLPEGIYSIKILIASVSPTGEMNYSYGSPKVNSIRFRVNNNGEFRY